MGYAAGQRAAADAGELEALRARAAQDEADLREARRVIAQFEQAGGRFTRNVMHGDVLLTDVQIFKASIEVLLNSTGSHSNECFSIR